MKQTLHDRILENPRKEYLDSLEGKATQILVRYTYLAEMNSWSIIKIIFDEVHIPSDCDEYLGMIYEGNIELTYKEVEEIAKLVSNEFGYDDDDFFCVLKDKLENYKILPDEKKNLRAQTLCIADVAIQFR